MSELFGDDNIKNIPLIEPGEVLDIILDESHPLANNDPKNIGRAQIRRVITDKGKETESCSWFGPLFPNGQIYPLIHEMVLLLIGPKKTAGVSSGAQTSYYMGPINVWGLENYNPVPGTGINMAEEAKEAPNGTTYANFTGNVPKQDTVKEDISFGDTFVAKPEIMKLRPYEGDRILEGRWGQSIRLGSTVREITSGNWQAWSSRGDSGDPIIIIRNGEPSDASNTKSLVEDINNDPSSIYITSNQLINLELASMNFKTYGLALQGSETCAWVSRYIPELPHSYDKRQIVLNSGRLILNSQDDSIFLNANRSISLSSKGSIHLDSDKPTVINGSKVHLGLNSREPGILGDTMVSFLRELLTAIITADVVTPTGPGLMGPGTLSSCTELMGKLDSLLCEKVRVE
jgi:hypothetical protein